MVALFVITTIAGFIVLDIIVQTVAEALDFSQILAGLRPETP